MNGTRTLRRPSPLAWSAASGFAVGLGMVALVPAFASKDAVALLLGVLGALGAILVITYPCIGIAAIYLVWLSDFSPALLGQRFLTVPYLMTAVLLVPLGATLLRDRSIRFFDVPQVRLLLAIGGLHVISTWWNSADESLAVLSGRDSTQRDLVIFAARLLFLAFVFYFVHTKARIEGILWVVVGSIVVAAILSWGPILAGGSIDRLESSLFDMNSNRLALVSMFATTMIWSAYTYGQDERWRMIALPLLLILPATVLASGSRAGLLQAAALGFLILGERQGWSVKRRFRTFAFLAAAALFILIVVPSALLERTIEFDTSTSAAGGRSLQSRIAQHEAALYLYMENPLLGIGIGNFESLATDRFNVRNTLHNSYLLAVIEGGPFLLLLYLALFAATWRQLRRLEKEGPPDFFWLVKGLRFALALFLVASVTADLWLHELPYLILGLTMAVAAGSPPRNAAPEVT